MKDLREWVQLLFVVVGGVIALFAFFQNLKQRRVENALKFISLFREGLEKDDLVEWIDLLRSSSECAGVPPGNYVNARGELTSIGSYFSEGSSDNYAISRMAQSLDVVCHQIISGAADARTVYYELGQLLNFMNYQLSSFRAPVSDQNFLEYACPNINAVFKKYGRQFAEWPFRIYAYVE